jgi:uncharacterized protein YndB with AHSA1/START domain
MYRNGKTRIIAEPGKQELWNIREFDAPRELVFRAFLEGDLYKQWYGSRRTEMVIESFAAKSGGNWRYVLKSPNGYEAAFHGIFHDVTAPERIIETVEFDGAPKGHVVLRTSRFEALPGNRTKFTVQLVAQAAADRDAMMPPGYEKDVNESYERLDETLGKMKSSVT